MDERIKEAEGLTPSSCEKEKSQLRKFAKKALTAIMAIGIALGAVRAAIACKPKAPTEPENPGLTQADPVKSASKVEDLIAYIESNQYRASSDAVVTKATISGIEIKETDTNKEIPTETVLQSVEQALCRVAHRWESL